MAGVDVIDSGRFSFSYIGGAHRLSYINPKNRHTENRRLDEIRRNYDWLLSHGYRFEASEPSEIERN